MQWRFHDEVRATARRSRVGKFGVLAGALTLVAAGVSGAHAAPASAPAFSPDAISVVVSGTPAYSVTGPVNSGGISVLDNIGSHLTQTVAGSATLANGAQFSVNVSRSGSSYTGTLSVTGTALSLTASVKGGLTRTANDTVTWAGSATVHQGASTSTRQVTVTVVDNTPDPGDHVLTIQHANVTRYVAVHVPVGKGGVSNLAAVVHFPGLIETAAIANSFSKFTTAADKYGYLAVIPEHHGRGWQGVPYGTTSPALDDPGFVRQAMALVKSRFLADPTRIYSTGMSNGSWFSQQTACTMSDIFAAWADVSGPLTSADQQTCQPGRHVPMLMFHGTKDPLVPFSTAAPALAFWAKNNGCLTTTTDTALPDVDPTDGTTVVQHVYNGCPADGPVVFYEIVGGGHQWPDGTAFPLVGKQTHDIQGNDIIWTFLSQFRLSSAA